MYHNFATYEKIVRVIIDMYCDYNITDFPVDEKDLCKKLGIRLIPYSNYKNEDYFLLCKRSKQGFFANDTKNNEPVIFYNDIDCSRQNQRFTIFHEIKHFVFEDTNDDDDDLADFFSRFFMCPVPYLLLENICISDDISSFCDVSKEAATNAASNINNRKKRYGRYLFEYERPLIKLLNPVLYESIINDVGGDDH